jgi:ferredoxin-NADP reductase
VFLAGGIGITPFHSILLRAAREPLPHRLFLFYANRRPEDAPFLQELEALQRQNPRYICVPTMTDMSRSHRPWLGETGVINQAMLAKYLKSAVSPIYLAGPPGIVGGMRTVLHGMGIDDDDIQTEELPATECTYSRPRPLRRGGIERSQLDSITSSAVKRHRLTVDCRRRRV